MVGKEVDELKLNYDKACEHRENGEYKLAVESFYKALDVEPENIDVMTQLAELYSLMNDIERSIRYYKDILEVDENNLCAICALYNKNFAAEKFKDALEFALRAVQISPSDKTYIQLVNVLDKFADIKALRDLVNAADLSENVRLKISDVYVKHAFVADAEALLQNISDSDEKKAVQALIAFNKNELETARNLVMGLNIENVDVLNLKGLFFIEDMKFIDAVKCFAKAAALEPANPKLYFNLGNAYFYNGWLEEAGEAYRKAVSLDVSNVDYRFALANLYYESKDFAKARLEVANIQHIDDEHLDTKVLDALLKYQQKDYLGAKEELEKALALASDKKFVRTSLARVLVDLQLFERAESLIKDENDIESLCVLAYLFTEQKKYSEALELVEKLIADNHFYMPAYSVAMKAAYGAEDLEKVQHFAQSSLEIDINFAAGYYYLALVRKSKQDYDEAIECLKRAITFDLTNPEYYAEMARVYLANEDVKSALEYANEAVTIDSTSAEYMQLYSDLAAKKRNICRNK
ncbi:MAG: tetratricopeptide repeat protein [Fusobacterium sp.]|nr:tetratricopeptide repeat protein [Fusobacterium sp.]